MESFARIIRLHTTFKNRRGPISAGSLQEKLECSRPTLFRALSHLRDRLGAPVVNVPGEGYRYDRGAEEFELPGLWLNADELHALLSMDVLLEKIEPGILHEYVTPFRSRIEAILKTNEGKQGRKAEPVRERVRILQQHARTVDTTRFATVAAATLQRRRVLLGYRSRVRDQATEREVSPLRLVHYRDNWYVDGFCHTANALRTFSLDRVTAVEALEAAAHEVDEEHAQQHFAAGYGIFAGAARFNARLLFTAERARWVADEVWHPEQAGQFRTDGSYELTVPYADERELLGDILRHGAEVEVLGPRRLRDEVAKVLRAASFRYQPGSAGPVSVRKP